MGSVSNKQIIRLCHSFATMLQSGLAIEHVLSVVASQSGGGRLRRALKGVLDGVRGGQTLAEAFGAQQCFPPLFLDFVAVGEETGGLDHTMAVLGRLYEFQGRLRRRFLTAIALPVLQYLVAVAVVCITRYVMSRIAGGPGSLLTDLVVGYGVPAALVLLYFFVVKPLGGSWIFHHVAMRVPVLRNVFRTLALARFSLQMYLFYEAGVPITDGIERSLQGTGNHVFAARAVAARAALLSGETLADTLAGTGLFPADYIAIISVAEEAGALSERLDWLASEYARRTETALGAVATAAAVLIWLAVAAVIVTFIFKIFMSYVGSIRGAMEP